MTGIHEPKGPDRKPLKSGFEEIGKGLPPVDGVRLSHHDEIIVFLDRGAQAGYYKSNIEKFIPLEDMRDFGAGALGRNGIENPFMDKEGNPHATMECVWSANDEIRKRNYQKINKPQIEFPILPKFKSLILNNPKDPNSY